MLSKNTSDSLEQRLLENACIIAMLLAIVSFFVNTILIDNQLMAISSGIGGPLMGLLYYYTRSKKNLFVSTFLFILIALSTINVCWFATDGLDGASPFFFIVLMVVISSLISMKYYSYFIVIIGANILMLVQIERAYPHLVSPYKDLATHQFDIIISIFNAILWSGLAILVFRKGFIKNQEQLLSKNIELEQSKKELELSTEKAKKANRIKSDFLSTMSHEIRTPLNAIIGISNLLQQYNYDEEKKADLIHALNNSSKNLLELLNDILDFNKIESGKTTLKPQEVDLKSNLNDLVQAHHKKALVNENKITLNFSPEFPKQVFLDNYHLKQVLNKLISNGLKFTKKGQVNINVKLLKKDAEQISILFEVEDNGRGISKEHQATIFDKFTQAPKTQQLYSSGTGLGLAISFGLLKLMGSTLKVKSNEDKGSKFYFTLDCLVSKQNSSTTVPKVNTVLPTELADLSSNKILLVEDNKTNVLVVSHFLKRWDIPFEVAYNGLEALKFFEEQSFQLILMDMQMPIMDGFEATEKIRQKDRNIPILALTASATAHEKERAESAGVNAYITKPFDPTYLYKIIQKHLVV